MNLYDILGVPIDAAAADIKMAYRILAQRHHPDRWGGDGNIALERMKEINFAYAILRDPARRSEYDTEIGITRSRPQAIEQVFQTNRTNIPEYSVDLRECTSSHKEDENEFKIDAAKLTLAIKIELRIQYYMLWLNWIAFAVGKWIGKTMATFRW